MSRALQALVWLYERALRLYPRAYRQEYDREMKSVFERTADTADKRGILSLIRLCLRELCDLPGAILYEHWRDVWRSVRRGTRRNTKEVRMTGWSGNGHVWDDLEDAADVGPGSWRDALLAALPHLLVALAIGVPGLSRTLTGLPFDAPVIQVLSIALGVITLATIVALIVVAWRRGWPRWSASLYGYALLMATAPIGMLMREWNVPLGYQLTNAFWTVALPISAAGLLYAVGQWDSQRGLLTALPLAVLIWSSVLEFVPSPARDLASLGAWLLTASAAAIIVRLGNLRAATWTAVAVSLVVGLDYSYVRTYHHNLPPGHGKAPSLSTVSRRLVPLFLSSCTLIVGPLLARALRKIGVRGRAMGLLRLGYPVAVAGLGFDLAGHLAAFWWYTSGRWLAARPAPGDLGFALPAYLGVALYTVGIVLLGAAAWRHRRPRPRAAPMLLVIALLAVPTVSALPLVYNFRSIPEGWPLGLAVLNSLPQGLVYAVSAAWLLLSGWLASRRVSKYPAV